MHICDLVDPHPGNIFVLDDGSIGLIDFGQVRTYKSMTNVSIGL